MKKRMIVWLFLLLACVPGHAQERGPLLVREGQREIEALWARETQTPFQRGHYDWRVPLKEHLLGDTPPDIIYLRTYNENYPDLIRSGLLADLSGHAQIRETIDSLRPLFKAVFIQPGGEIYGVPRMVTVRGAAYWLPDAWRAAGLDEGTAPASFEELLDFLDVWADQPADAFCVFRVADGPDQRVSHFPHSEWLIGMLVEIWASQAQYAGERPVFQQALFITWLNRAATVGRKLDQRAGHGIGTEKTPLFYPRAGRGVTDRAEETYTLRHALPLRLTGDQPPLLRVSADLLCVRKGSPWQREAIPMAGAAARADTPWSDLILHPGSDPSDWNKTAERPEHCITPAWLDSIDDTPYIPFLPVLPFQSDDGYIGRVIAFLAGGIGAGDFAAALDAAARRGE